VIVNIEKADEIPDFANHLGDLDDIFFKSSVKRDFRTYEERQYFREEMSLGRYIVKHRDSFFVALNGVGRPIGYLAGCLENPTQLDYFNDIAYFRYIEDICQNYPAHLHINIVEQYRGRGVGTALVERFVNWAEVHSVSGIQVVTSSTSRSIPFYRRLRFTELRVFPWNSGTAVCMGRQLADGR
jgi:GNAT superfamily N-acetyltransferase